MQIRNLTGAALLAAVTACGGAGMAGGPAPDGALAVRMPSMSAASYVRADTTVVGVDAGMMGTFDVNVNGSSTVDVGFAEDAGGVMVTATYSAVDGAITNPMGAPISVDESAVSGQLVFTVDGRGRSTVTERLQVETDAIQLVSPSGLAYDLFPRLPDRAVSMGDSWTDTISVNEDVEGVASETTTVVTYTVAGDTVVAGQSLMKLNTISEVEASVNGSMQGMAMTQNMSGSASGWVLWDAAASLVHSAFSVADMAGIMTVDAPGAPDMSLTISSKSYTSRGGS